MLNDVRYAIRKLRQNPGFALTAIVSIALASGANTAIFSVLNSVLLRPLPYANPHQLAIVWEKHPAVPFDRIPTSPADFDDWKAQAKPFERLSAFGFGGPAMTLTGAGEPESRLLLRFPRMRSTWLVFSHILDAPFDLVMNWPTREAPRSSATQCGRNGSIPIQE